MLREPAFPLSRSVDVAPETHGGLSAHEPPRTEAAVQYEGTWIVPEADWMSETPIRFHEDLYEPFYGGKQFSISDLNGFELVFQST